jgi:hypothetical protein
MKFLSSVDLKAGSTISGQTIARVADIPTTLPANGGNSDTVGNLAPSSFLRSNAKDTQTGGIVFSNGISLQGSIPSAMDLNGSFYYNSSENEFKGKVNGTWRNFFHEGNFNPSSKLDSNAKAVDSSKLDGLTSDKFKKVSQDGFTEYTRTYTMTSSSPQPLLDLNGNDFGTTGNAEIYVEAFITATGTVTGAIAVFKASNGGAWSLSEIHNAGRGSNHPEFAIINGKPYITHSHTSSYTVTVNHKLTGNGTRLYDFYSTLWNSNNFNPSSKVDASVFNNHKIDTSNPHSVTKSQVGLGSVLNYGIASTADAQAGTSDSAYMTPLKTKNAIDSLQAVKSVAGRTGAVTLSKSDVGLSVVENKTSATIRGEITSSNVTSALGYEPENPANRGQANGYASLDSGGKIPLSLIPDVARQQTHVVLNSTARNALTGLVQGDKAFETSTGDSYVWNGSAWLLMADADWANVNISWSNITGKPSSDVSTIDDAVNKRHTHSNQSILDATSASFTTALKSKLDAIQDNAINQSTADARYYTKTNLQTSGQSQVHWGNLTGVPTTFTPATHYHDDRYFTETEITTNYYSKTNLQTSGQSQVHWNNITSKPTSMPASGGNADTVGGLSPSSFIRSDADNSADISFTDASRFWLRTAGNWGIYWDTSSNEIQFQGAGTKRFAVDLDNGNTSISGNLAIVGSLDMQNDPINNLTYLNGQYGRIARSTDEWLRINDDSSHTSGVFFGSSHVRTDGSLAIGSSGADVMIDSNGIKIKNKFTIQYNSSEDSLDFVYG